MTPVDLRAWRAQRGLTQVALAALLGISPRQLQYYEAGTAVIPRVVELALDGLPAARYQGGDVQARAHGQGRPHDAE